MKKHKSISHLIDREQSSLHCIKNIIVEHSQPLLIYCFSSSVSNNIQHNCFTLKHKADDWNFACSLLIIVSDETSIGDNLKKEIEELASLFGTVTTVIQPLVVMIEQLKEQNLFFSWVRRSALLLYEKANTTQLLPPTINGRNEYRQQAERFYLGNPDLANYMTEKLIPVISAAKEQQETANINL